MGALDLSLVIATLLYVGVGAVVGVRLLRLHRRTRGFPELALGLGECLLAGVVPPFFVVVQAAPNEAIVRAAVFVGHFAYTAGCAVMVLFTWRVFRADAVWARALALAMIAVLVVAGALGMARAFLPADLAALRQPQTPAFVLMEWISVLGFLWTSAEALRHHGLLRKQAALGLVDPVVVDRLLLWCGVGLAGLLAAGAPAIAALLGISTMTHAPTRMLCALGTLASSLFIQLAFLPPEAYLRWVRERSARSLARG